MEKIMANGFCELNEHEMTETDGGIGAPAAVGIAGGLGLAIFMVWSGVVIVHNYYNAYNGGYDTYW